MTLNRSFRFVDDRLNGQLISLLKRSDLPHRVDKHGTIYYSSSNEDLVENDVICSIRDHLYPSWQIISCPSVWAESYKDYMTEHGVPFIEELTDNQLSFLIPRKYRPHSWKLDLPTLAPSRLAR